MTNRTDQAGLVVQDIARSSVILKHRYKLDAKTRAEVRLASQGCPQGGEGEAEQAEQREAPVKHAALLVILSCLLVAFPAHAGQGWYLLTPPLGVTAGVAVEHGAPLSRWDQSGGYDTATDCETDIRIRTELLKRHAADETRADWYRQQQRVLYERYLHARCVTTDDPRLNQ